MPEPPNWLGGPYTPATPVDTLIRDKLVELRVLESEEDEKASRDSGRGKPTPQTLQVITSGASQLSKWWIGLVGTGFGFSALLQGVVGLGWEPFGIVAEPSNLQQAVLTASAAAVASALVIAIAIMVRGDVASRALATAAEYNARAVITQALIGGFQYPTPAAPPAQAHYVVTTSDGTEIVKSFGRDGQGMYVETMTGRKIRGQDITGLDPAPK